jgi:hypothetical protein
MNFGYDERFGSRRILGGSSCGSRKSRNSCFFERWGSWSNRINRFFAFEKYGSWSSCINGLFAFWRHDKELVARIWEEVGRMKKGNAW